MADATGKTCKLCGEWKSLDDYHRRSRAKDGRQGRCKACAIRASAEWYAANKERAAARTRARRAETRDAVSEYHKRYYEKNKSKWQTPEARASATARAKATYWAKKNDPEYRAKRKALQQSYYERNRDKKLADARRYDLERRDDPRRQLARRNNVRRRRARKTGNGVYVVTSRDLQRLIARHDGLCAYCHLRQWEHLDHVIPIARGGRHSIGNLVPACAECNLSKHARLPIEFRLSR